MTISQHLDDIQMLSHMLDNYELYNIAHDLRNHNYSDFRRIIDICETEARIRQDYESLEFMEMSGLIHNNYL